MLLKELVRDAKIPVEGVGTGGARGGGGRGL